MITRVSKCILNKKVTPRISQPCKALKGTPFETMFETWFETPGFSAGCRCGTVRFAGDAARKTFEALP